MSTLSVSSSTVLAMNDTYETNNEIGSNKKRKIQEPPLRRQTIILPIEECPWNKVLEKTHRILKDYVLVSQEITTLIVQYTRSPFYGKITTFKVITDNSHLNVYDPQNGFHLIGQFRPLLELAIEDSSLEEEKIFKRIVVNYISNPCSSSRDKKHCILVEHRTGARSVIKEFLYIKDVHFPVLENNPRAHSEKSFTIWKKDEAKQLLQLIGPPNNCFPEGVFEKLIKLTEQFSS